MCQRLQAYVHAVADRRQLAKINIALIFFATAQVVLSILLVRLRGALGGVPSPCWFHAHL